MVSVQWFVEFEDVQGKPLGNLSNQSINPKGLFQHNTILLIRLENCPSYGKE